MAPIAVLSPFIYIHGHDFTGDENNFLASFTRAAKDKTTFRSAGWEEVQSGQYASSLEHSGFWQAAADSVDAAAFTDLGVANRVHSAGMSEVEGQPALMWLAGFFTYSAFGQLGEIAPFNLTSRGTDGVGPVRGQLAKALGNVSGTGQLGSVLNLGAPTSTQFVYCTVHIFTAGTTITLQLQSDDNAGMSSPTTRATIGPLTATGGTYMTRLAGPFAGETHWRLNVSAITGTFSIAAAIAVQ